MVILIAGGTGFIGQSLASELISRGHRIMVLSRNQNKVQRLFGNAVTGVEWGHLTIHTIAAVDAVINLAGATIGNQRWSSKRQQEILDSRLKTTQILTQFCSQLGARSPPLLNASAIGVYDFSDAVNRGRHHDEDSVIEFNKSPSFLAYVARAWEMATWSARDKGVRVINCRFGVVLAPQGGALKELLPSFRLGLGAKIGSGLQPFSYIGLQDAMRAINFIMDNSSLSGPVNIVSPCVVSQEQFADALAKVLHRPRFLRLPAFAVKLLFGQMGEELLLKGTLAKPKRLVDHGFQFLNPTLQQVFSKTIANK